MTAHRLECMGVQLVRRGVRGDPRVILDSVNAEFPGGTVSLLQGATGAGKTSLLGLLAAIIRPTSGEIRADGQPVSRWVSRHRDQWRRRVGMAFQAPHLIADLTAAENVMLPLIPTSQSRDRMRQRVVHALAAAGAENLARSRPTELSAGERQRVALARATVSDPDFLLLDEPTAFQDLDGVERVVCIVKEAAARGAVVMVATHDPRLVDTERVGTDLADAHWSLRKGRLERAT